MWIKNIIKPHTYICEWQRQEHAHSHNNICECVHVSTIASIGFLHFWPLDDNVNETTARYTNTHIHFYSGFCYVCFLVLFVHIHVRLKLRSLLNEYAPIQCAEELIEEKKYMNEATKKQKTTHKSMSMIKSVYLCVRLSSIE